MPGSHHSTATHTSTEIRGGHTGHLRRANLDRVQAFAMDRPGPFTRADLVKATGLSAPTAGSLLAHLVRRGLVRDLGTGPSRGGRRPASMEFNARYGFVAAIAIGTDKTQLAVADLRGVRLASRVMAPPRDLDPPARLSQIATTLQALARDANVPADKLLAVSTASPGLVDPDTGMVMALAPGLRGWSNVPVASILGDVLGVPVLVENDVNLAVLGEHWRGAARGHDTCAYVEVGAGIGAGILIDGRLHRGPHRMAGEIAFMCMAPRYAEAEGGPHGCLESLAGLEALAARWPRPCPVDPDRWLADLYAAARAGDGEARTAVEEAATLVGIAVANLCLVIDPSLVVVGGAAPAPGSLFMEQLQRVVGRILPAPTAVVASALGEEASLWGGLLTATAHVREQLRPRLQGGQAR